MHDNQFLDGLDTEVLLELSIAESSGAAAPSGESPTEWLFDPSDVEREQVGLRNIQGALEALQNEPPQ